jgi:hypothetical protein
MRTPVAPLASAALAISLVLSACTAAPPAANGPEAVVTEALAKTAVKDVEGLRGLACAGQEELVREQLSLGGMTGGSGLLPGVDLEALLASVQVDVANVDVGTATVDGDVAQVPVEGSMKVTFDPAAIRPIIKAALEGQGQSMTDEQLDGLVKTLEALGQDVPVNQSIRLVREGEAWKICQETLEAPAAS